MAVLSKDTVSRFKTEILVFKLAGSCFKAECLCYLKLQYLVIVETLCYRKLPFIVFRLSVFVVRNCSFCFTQCLLIEVAVLFLKTGCL